MAANDSSAATRDGTFRGLRSSAVGQTMRTMLEERLISAESEYRGAREQYSSAMRLQRRIASLENEGHIEQSEQLKVRLMETLLKGAGEESRESLRQLEREVMAERKIGDDGIERIHEVAGASDSEASRSSGIAGDDKNGIRGRGSWMKGYRKSIFISVCAWIAALVGLCVSVTFLTRDFVNSRRNPVIARDFQSRDELELPIISICSTNVDVPAFATFPNSTYKGHPLFTIDEIEYLEEGRTVQYPLSLKDFDLRVLGPSVDECRTRLNTMNAQVASETTGQLVLPTQKGRQCAQCLSIGARNAIKVNAHHAKKGLPSGISINVVLSRMYSFCFIESVRMFGTLRSIFATELMRNAKQLSELGILDFNGHVDLNDEQAVLESLYVQQPDQEGLQGLPQVFFYCNVYFFSGYFYPTDTRPDMKFRYQGKKFPQTWKRVPGTKGPYYEVIGVSSLDELLEQKSLGLAPVEGKKDIFSLLNSIALTIYAEDRSNLKGGEEKVVGTNSLVAQIDHSKGALIRFRQQGSIGSKPSIRVALLSTTDDRPQGSVEGAFFSNRLNFTYDRFLTESLSQQVTYSVWQFVADLLEVLTLFTGLSFYSVIVVPATAFLVQRQRKRRRQAIQRALAEAQPTQQTTSESSFE